MIDRVTLSPDVKDVLSFLARGGSYGYYWTPANGDGNKLTSWYDVDNIVGIPQMWIDNGWSVYFGVNPVNVKESNFERAKLNTVASINCLFGEFDVKDYGDKASIIDHLQNLKVSGTPYPTLIVDSGGGYHCYWFIADPVLVTSENRHGSKCQLYAWIDHVNSDPQSKDITRVLRVPGTLNTKPAYAPDYPTVTIEHLDWGNVYTLEQLQSAMNYDPLADECKEPERIAFTPLPIDGDRLRKYCVAGLNGECDNVVNAKEGTRNATLFKAAANVGELVARGGISQVEAESALINAALACGLEEREAKGTIRSGFEHGKENPRNIKDRPFTPTYQRMDTEGDPSLIENYVIQESEIDFKKLNSFAADDESNACVMSLLYPDKFCFNPNFGWMYWDGRMWKAEGATFRVEKAATETLIARQRAAQKSDTLSPKKFAPDRHLICNLRDQFKVKVFVEYTAFDQDKDTLNVRNGLLNLRTGELTPHHPTQYNTYVLNYDYNPDASYKHWVEWLTDTCGKENTDYLQLVCGYIATGHINEEVAFYVFGPTRSGKGTFTETLLALFGKHLSSEVPFSTFTEKRSGDSQNFDLAALRNCRFIAASESEEHEKIRSGMLKSITGGSNISCSFKHKDSFQYRPQFKILMTSNYLPNIAHNDEAAWNRLRMVEFPHSRKGEEDKSLKWKMLGRENLEGVLLWITEGAKKWFELGSTGLKEPASSIKTKEEQIELLDFVKQWFDECCIKDSSHFIASSEAYESYFNWCKKSGVEPRRQGSFSKQMIQNGFESKSKSIKTALGFVTKRGFDGFTTI